MTAINAFADNHAAYLSTDGAVYDVEKGTMVEEGAKALVFPSLSIVAAATGRVFPMALLDAIHAVHSIWDDPTQASILEAMPAALKRARNALRSHAKAERCGANASAVTIALWDRSHGMPKVLRVVTEDFPGEGTVAYSLREHHSGWSMPGLSADEQASIFPKGVCDEPRTQMAGMLNIQRRKHVSAVAGGCAVGGPCYFYTVRETGVAVEQFMRFPDRVGEPFDATRGARLDPVPNPVIAR